MTLAHLLPHWALHRSMLILVVSFAAFAASGAANAIRFNVNGVCTGGGQLCNNIEMHSVNVGAGGVGQGQFTPGPLTCSNFRVHFIIDGEEVAVTPFVGHGQSTGFVSLGLIGPGTHTIGVQAEGETGGCNAGNLLSWAGTIKLRKAP